MISLTNIEWETIDLDHSRFMKLVETADEIQVDKNCNMFHYSEHF